MSLRRRIAAAAALAVAAAAVAVAVIGYVSTRSHLIGEVKSELVQRAQQFLAPHGGGGDDDGGGGGGPGQPASHGQGFQFPGPPPFGGAGGDFQIVEPDGRVAHSGGLPVTERVLGVARKRSGSFFFDARVGQSRTHEEIYTAWDGYDQHVVQVGEPLTGVDAVLNGLLLPYGLLIGGGIVLAGLLGLAISRSALAPIERFVTRTERVTQELDLPGRLEETDPIELRRLAASFNHTLDALERSIEAQRQLVADASHELRTPIAALRSDIQIFLDSDRLPAREREGLQQSILTELDELTRIVADVVELARGSAPSLAVEPVELDTIVMEAVERTQRRAPNLQFKLDLERTAIDGVPERIARAVANVIDNARKWSPPHGTVVVELHRGTLTVRDHGPGFQEKDLPHVFDRFYRADRARRMPGSGLGLAIVKQAAEAHGGGAEAANAAGGGAVVKVSFGVPLARPSDADQKSGVAGSPA